MNIEKIWSDFYELSIPPIYFSNHALHRMEQRFPNEDKLSFMQRIIDEIKNRLGFNTQNFSEREVRMKDILSTNENFNVVIMNKYDNNGQLILIKTVKGPGM